MSTTSSYRCMWCSYRCMFSCNYSCYFSWWTGFSSCKLWCNLSRKMSCIVNRCLFWANLETRGFIGENVFHDHFLIESTTCSTFSKLAKMGFQYKLLIRCRYWLWRSWSCGWWDWWDWLVGLVKLVKMLTTIFWCKRNCT